MILYVDMDDTIASFSEYILAIDPTVEMNKEHDPISRDKVDTICLEDPHIFRKLEPIPGSIEAVHRLNDHYEIYFLSTPMWIVPESFTDKRHWIEQYFPEIGTKKLILTHRKDLNVGEFLVDDRKTNGSENFKGHHIHFGSERFPDWEAVEKFLTPVFVPVDFYGFPIK